MKKNLLLCVLLNEDFKKSKILLLYHIMYCLNNNLDYKIIVENTEFDVFWTKIKYIQFYLHMYDNIILINSNVYVPYKSTNILKNINLNFINVKLLNNQFDNSLIIFKNDKIVFEFINILIMNKSKVIGKSIKRSEIIFLKLLFHKYFKNSISILNNNWINYNLNLNKTEIANLKDNLYKYKIINNEQDLEIIIKKYIDLKKFD